MYQVSADQIRAVLLRAEMRRSSVLSSRTVDAWRWINGTGDGAPAGLTIDRYGPFLVIGAREHLDDTLIERWASEAERHARAEAVVLKRLASAVNESTSRVIAGRLPPEPVKVREDDAVFLCEL